jgi:hypothetical protein
MNNAITLQIGDTRIVRISTNEIIGIGSTVAGPVGATGAAGAAGATGAKGDKGDPGDAGAAATIAAGTTTTGAAGSSATVSNAGTSSAAVFNFTIPRGDVGATGDPGAAATIAAGTTTTGAAGSSAAVSNVGTSSAAVFNFTIPQGIQGIQGIQGDTGPSGVIAVTAPITNSGTSTSATIGVDAGSTTAAGVLQLTNSTTSTSTTTAATANSVKVAVDRFEEYLHMSSTTMDVFPRTSATAAVGGTSGVVRCTYFTAPMNMTVSQITFVGGTTASSGLTLARFGLYDATTLVARTANDTTLFNAASTAETRSFDTTDGFPATFNLVAGTRYGVAMIVVGTTPNNAIGVTHAGGTGSSLLGLTPRINGITNGQSDFQTNTPPVGNNVSYLWARLS